MSSTTTLVHLVRAPRSAIVHVSVRGELTLCHRMVADTWSSELIEPAGAQDTTTCAACCAGMDLMLMRVRQLEQLPVEPEPAAELPVDRTPLTLLVVPCSGKKLDRPAPARELYRGTLTTMGLAAADVIVGSDEWVTGHAGCRAMILSALHGLVEPEQVLAPYDVRMGDPDSITAGALALQLAATGATRVVALTPSAYTAALRAACELAGVELVAAFEGLRGIGDQRGLLAALRRSGGYGAEHGRLLQLETRRMVQLHADALAEDRARTAAAAPAISTDEQLRDRMLAGGASPERAQMVVDARNQLQRELTAAAPAIARALEDAPELAHLMDDSLLALCGAHGPRNGYLHVTPTPADVTCPDCQAMLPGWMRQQHSEALAENVAHDAAMETAEPLNAYLARLDLGQPRLPQTLRTMAQTQRRLSLVPPR